MLKLINVFKKTALRQTMMDELEEAQRDLLKAQTGLEWATSQVAYNRARVERLNALLSDASTPESWSTV